MKDQTPIPRSEYAVLSPVERHAKLVELHHLLPKSSPYAEWEAALDEESEAVKPHNEVLRNGSESNEEFFDFVRSYYRKNQINLDELQKKGDLERERRSNSEDKKLLLGKVSELLEFSPTTDEFKQVVVELFSNDYDDGQDGVNKSDSLWNAILVEKTQSGGFFNQEHASDIEVLAYREKKSRLDMSTIWNNLIERARDGGTMMEELISKMRHIGVNENVRFLEKWEQTIKGKYHIEEL